MSAYVPGTRYQGARYEQETKDGGASREEGERKGRSGGRGRRKGGAEGRRDGEKREGRKNGEKPLPLLRGCKVQK